jgi:RimJ/RimL family protein N-acetyltransferase
MIVRPWKLGDTEKIMLQPAQEYLSNFDSLSIDLTDLSDQGLVWVGEVEGEIVAIAGIMPQWENRAIAWAFISKSAGKHFSKIHKAVKRFLDQCDCKRIEATVDVDFHEGSRWIEMLGFEYEGLMRAYRPDGADMFLYAKVK